MTDELEAKTLWCPFARSMVAIDDDQRGSNRHVEDTFNSVGNLRTHPQAGTCCLASGCMMWRKAGQIGIGPDGKRRERDMDGLTRWIDKGYCGLAGNPATIFP